MDGVNPARFTKISAKKNPENFSGFLYLKRSNFIPK
jgi:hypothetical protein